MRAINGENLKLLCFDAPYPTCGVCGLAVRWHHIRIAKRGEARLSFRELADGTQRYPGDVPVRASTENRRQEESNNRNGKRRGEISMAKNSGNTDVEAAALKEEAVGRALDGKTPKKVIVVPNRIVNIVV